MNIGEIFIKLGFKADTFTLKDFGKSLSEIPIKGLAAVGAMAGVSLEISHLVKEAMGAAQGFQIFSAMTDMNTDKLQKWQIVAKQVGISGEVVSGSMMGINNALAAIENGTGAGQAEAFGRLGIEWAGKTPDQIFEEVHKKFQKLRGKELRDAEQFLPGIGMSSPEIVRLLRMSDREVADKQKNVGIMSEHDIEGIAHFKEVLVKLAEITEHLIVPPMSKLADILVLLTPAFERLFGVTTNAVTKKLGEDAEGIKTIMAAPPGTMKSIGHYLVHDMPKEVYEDGRRKGQHTMTDKDWSNSFNPKKGQERAESWKKAIGNVIDQIRSGGQLPSKQIAVEPAVTAAAKSPAMAYQPPTNTDIAQSPLNLVQNIHSMADPDEVARFAIEHLKREYSFAASNLDQEGR